MERPFFSPRIRQLYSAWTAVVLLAGLPGVTVAAEPPPAAPQATPLADATAQLVAQALAANPGLGAQQAGVSRRVAELDRARARYLPSLDFSARYSRADGGRTIDFPLGDLLNPVYEALDAQLIAQGQPPRFPRVSNQSIALIREREQETTLTLSQPLYDARLGAARDAATAQLDAADQAAAAYRTRLARDIKQGYYGWLRANAAVTVLTDTRELAAENLRVNESLFRNGKITEDRVFRARADLLEVEQQLLAAGNARAQAAAYVNALRHQPGDTPLPVAVVTPEDVAVSPAQLPPGGTGEEALSAQLAPLQDAALKNRAELKQLDAAIAGAQAGGRAARAAFKPQLALQVTGGTQGADYGFSAQERFVLASVVMKFNLFSGGADRAGLAAASAQLSEARLQREDVASQVRLEVQQSLQDYLVNRASLRTADERLAAAEGAFRIVARKRDLGAANQAEFIDARRTLTDARLNIDVTRLATLSALAQLDYALGTQAGEQAPGEKP